MFGKSSKQLERENERLKAIIMDKLGEEAYEESSLPPVSTEVEEKPQEQPKNKEPAEDPIKPEKVEDPQDSEDFGEESKERYDVIVEILRYQAEVLAGIHNLIYQALSQPQPEESPKKKMGRPKKVEANHSVE